MIAVSVAIFADKAESGFSKGTRIMGSLCGENIKIQETINLHKRNNHRTRQKHSRYDSHTAHHASRPVAHHPRLSSASRSEDGTVGDVVELSLVSCVEEREEGFDRGERELGGCDVVCWFRPFQDLVKER